MNQPREVSKAQQTYLGILIEREMDEHNYESIMQFGLYLSSLSL